jgi:hypothetical protein
MYQACRSIIEPVYFRNSDVKHELIVAFERSEEPMANKHAKISIDCQL